MALQKLNILTFFKSNIVIQPVTRVKYTKFGDCNSIMTYFHILGLKNKNKIIRPKVTKVTFLVDFFTLPLEVNIPNSAMIIIAKFKRL